MSRARGIWSFFEFITSNHADAWRGIKRIVGNRANIFLENAVIMYYMSLYYKSYCDWIVEEARAASEAAVNARLQAKREEAQKRRAPRPRAERQRTAAASARGVSARSSGHAGGGGYDGDGGGGAAAAHRDIRLRRKRS